MMIEFITKRILIDTYKYVKKNIIEGGYILLSAQNDYEEAIANHVTRSLSHKNPSREKILLKDILEKTNRHLVFLGQPGAGKTTSMKYVCVNLITEEEFCKDIFSFPILIRLRDLNKKIINSSFSGNASFILVEHIWQILGLRIRGLSENELKEKKKKDKYFSSSDFQNLKLNIIIKILNDLKPLIVFEGYDEIPDSKVRNAIAKEFQLLARKISYSKMILTSRLGEFQYFNIEGAKTYEICHLSEKQIKEFANKWLKGKGDANELLNQIKSSPFYDTTMRPLNLANLCAIYERDGEIPEKPKSIYKKVINLLLEEWSRQNMVKRISKFSKFEVDRKFDFLSHLAFHFSVKHSKSIFSDEDLIEAFKSIHFNFGLEMSDMNKVILEIESHNGIFIKAGYFKYEFSHKSIQEYLTADYLIKLPNLPDNPKVLATIPNELALMVSLSSNPSLQFFDIIFDSDQIFNDSNDFVHIFLERIILEKIDFNPCIELAVVLVYLHNKLVYKKKKRKKVSDIVSYFINNMLEQKSTSQSIELLGNFYTISKLANTKDTTKRVSFEYQLYLRTKFYENYSYLPDHMYYVMDVFEKSIRTPNKG